MMAVRDTIRIRLNGVERHIRGVAHDRTLLPWLREEAGLTGSKEGCAEGDCGACSVMVGRADAGGGVRFDAVNACIQFMGMLDGTAIRTVDGLAGPDGSLHPIQQAMVDEHASQCGFCTPGFVMALTAAHASGAPMDGDHAPDLLAGNLCRCTGYGPIAAAAAKAGKVPRPDWDAERLAQDRDWIRTQHRVCDRLDFGSGAGRFIAPSDMDDLANLRAELPDATLLAGATDVGLWVTKHMRRIGPVLHLGRVEALRGITQRDDGGLSIGAGVTYSEAMAAIGALYADFGELIRRIGGVQVRNAGTIGGNIANGSPIGDTPPALMALDAELELRRRDGVRHVALADFFIAYGRQDLRDGEIVAAIHIPPPEPGLRLFCHKVSKRFDQDISALCGCFALVPDDAGKLSHVRIAFGGMAATPKRAATVEARLRGRVFDRASVEDAAHAFATDFSPIGDMRAGATYRLQVAGNLLRRCLAEWSGDCAATRLVGRGATLAGRRGDSSLPCGKEGGAAASGASSEGQIGAPMAHDSARKHVAGAARFIDDLPTPSRTLAVHIAMSDRAHARITQLDLSAVRAAPGVVAVLTAADVPGENDVSPIGGDDPMFADGLVEYAGQSLFAVAAEDMATARDAAGLALVDYEELPAILTVDQAMQAESLLEPPRVIRRGDADAAIAAAPHRLEGRIRIGGQEHFYLEGQAALALPGEDGELLVHSSTQHPSEVQHVVARVLGLANHAVTIMVRRMGGGFGGKESNANLPAAVAALVAARTGRPAKLRYDRDQDMLITGKRHDFRIDYRVGFDDDGRIAGVDFTQAARCGMSHDLSMPICDRAMLHADNGYYLPHARITSYRCKTHTVSNTAFRGFGGPQGMLGIERVMDDIAHRLDKDPADVRRVNLYDPPGAGTGRSLTPYGMAVEDCILDELMAELRESADYDRRRAAIRRWNRDSPILKRGIALTPVKFGISFTLTFLNQAGALVHVYNDGSIHLNHGGTEMGQGLFIKVAQVVARAFGVGMERVRITATSTGKVPNTSATAASSGSDLNGMAAADACDRIRRRLAEFAAERWQCRPDAVDFADDRVRIGNRTVAFDELIGEAYRARIPLSATGFYATPKISWDREAGRGRPFYYFAYGAAVSEVAIDTLTGENRILRVDILHDVGRSLNPAIDLGQIEGGFVQGAGWLTTEELWWNDAGQLKTHAPSTYKIPTLGDRAPDMRIALRKSDGNREETIHRSKAVGEPPLMLGISVLMALSDAVAAAGGYAHYPALDAPATPERILAAVARVRNPVEARAEEAA